MKWVKAIGNSHVYEIIYKILRTIMALSQVRKDR